MPEDNPFKDLIAFELALSRALPPVIQAIAIYDCEATKELVYRLDYDCKILAIAELFGEEAGPVVRWFYKGNPNWLFENGDLMIPAHIDSYGSAFVMSQAAFDHLQTGTITGIPPVLPDIGGVQVFNLNEEIRHARGRTVTPVERAPAEDREDHAPSEGEPGESGAGPEA